MKQCSICNKEVQKLWRSNPKTCYYCAKGLAQNALLSKKGSDTNQKKKSRLKPISKGRIKKCSAKQAERLKEYRKVRDEFLKKNPTCWNCGSSPTECHHGAGRVGSLLTDVTYFVALCRKCHVKAELSPEWAKENGFSFSRLDK